MNKKRKSEKGFTMVELVIVVAIMGIIGAVLVPAFGTMSTKARISADVATVKTLKRTADVYKAELGTWPSGGTFSELVSTLKSANYLEGTPKLQLQSLSAGISNDTSSQTIKLDLTSVSDAAVTKALEQIDSETTSDWIILKTSTSSNSEGN